MCTTNQAFRLNELFQIQTCTRKNIQRITQQTNNANKLFSVIISVWECRAIKQNTRGCM